MKQKLKTLYCSFLFLLISSTGGFSQGFSNYNWYFGASGQGVQFSKNTSAPDRVDITALNLGGTATASDRYTGSIFFYTDGNRVYESTNNLMLNGNGLNANTSGNQPVAICNVPNTADQYFIFTNTASYATSGTIEYTIVNMGASGNSIFPAPSLGEVSLINKNISTGITNASEAMIIIPNAAENGFWLITHENGASNYIVLPIDSTGSIGTPIVTPLGGITVAANISHNTLSDTLAVSPQSQGEEVELVYFDRATGSLSNLFPIPGTANTDFATEAIYDTEWSNGGNMLYLSRFGTIGSDVATLYQYDITNDSLLPVFTNNIYRSYGLQIAPDNSIYHIYQENNGGNYLLGSISSSDSIATNPSFNYQSRVFNNRDLQAQQFSTFLPPYDFGLTLNFSPNSGCLNSQVIFSPILTNVTGDTVNVDRAFWDFGDGIGFSGSIIPMYSYTDPSQLSPLVNLAVESGGQIYTTSGTMTLTDFQVQISMTTDTTFCTEDFPPPYSTNTNQDSKITANITGNYTSLNWFGPGGELVNFADNPTLVADSAGYYYIVVGDASGCSTYQGVNVKEYGAAEQRANIWYFGQNAGIDFNNGAIPIGDSQMNTIEGCAAISDRNGKIILYTDGVNVYDKEHTQITNKGIGGAQDATQSSIIVPFVGDETLYYIFTTEELYGSYTYQLKYSVFDLKLNNGTGALISENTLIFSPSTERVTASNNWLIAHEFGNNTFRAYPMTGSGIGQPVYSNIGISHTSTNDTYGQGYMELGVNNRLIVATSNPPNENYLEVFDFVDTTGILTNYRQIDMSKNGAIGQVYGIEASSGGNKLFASVIDGGNSQIFEYFFDSLDNPHFRQSLDISGQQVGAIQVGPDGQVYVAINNSNQLGTIIVNEDTTQNSIIDPSLTPFALSGGTQSTLGLPNFIQNISTPALTPTMTVMNGCPGDILNFTATGTDPIDEFRWNIVRDSDGVVIASSSIQNPTFTGITEPGTYTTTVLIYNHCINSPDVRLIMPFEIYTPPAFTIENIVDVTGACGDANGSFDVNITTSGLFNYSVLGPVSSSGTNLTSPTTITVDSLSSGAYNVIITDTNGCSTVISQALNDPVQFSSTYTTTTTDCDGIGGSLTISLTGTPGNNTIIYNLFDQNTGQLLLPDGSGTHDTNTSMIFTIPNVPASTYSLQLEDGASPACSEFTTDIEVTAPPDTELSLPLEASACGVTSITVDYTTNSSTGVTITGPANTQVTSTSITFGAPGSYTVTALGDGITNCDYSQDIEIIFNDITPSTLNPQHIICPEDPRPGFSTASLTVDNNFITVNWYDENGASLNGQAGYIISGLTIEVGVPGKIIAEMTNPFGCVTMDTINIVEDCQPRIVAPNAFRPNSNVNENQSFSIYHLFVSRENFSVHIFNRWGEIVYHSNDIDFVWNGGFNDDFSKPLPTGTYAYVMRYVDENNPESGAKQQRGGVLLIR
ncbi:MAG: gliding motility-associated C-terminal domain-containing protein [Cyclobacteriaceae bacterium]|nr:gliding motility-associated C-terminal domain-containing protein [Cyclobacteriaceae bacterium]